MPVRHRFTSSIASGVGNISLDWPDDTAGFVQQVRKNDLALLVIETANQAVTAPAGWTASYTPTGVGTGGTTTSTRLSVFHRRITENTSGSSGILTNPTVTDPGDHQVGQLFILSGIPIIDSISPIESVSTVRVTSTTGGFWIPGVTSSYQRNDLLFIASRETDSAAALFTGPIQSSSADLQNISKLSDVGTTSGNGGGFAAWEVFNNAPSGSPSGNLRVSASAAVLSEAVCISFVSDTGSFFYDRTLEPSYNGRSQTFANGVITLTPPHGMTTGQLVVMSLTTNSNTASGSIVSTGGQTWTPIVNTGTGVGRLFHWWASYNGSWTSNPSVSGSANGLGLVASMLVFDSGSDGSYTWNFEAAKSGSTTAVGTALFIPNGTVVTQNPKTLTVGFWGADSRRQIADLSPLTSSWAHTGMTPYYLNVLGTEALQGWAYNTQESSNITLPAIAKVADVNPTVFYSTLTFYRTAGTGPVVVPRFLSWITTDDY